MDAVLQEMEAVQKEVIELFMYGKSLGIPRRLREGITICWRSRPVAWSA